MKSGGTVITTEDKGDKIWIKAQSPQQPAMSIYVERTPQSRSVSPGDKVWWYRNCAYWTPKKAPFKDMPLRKSLRRRRFL